MANCKYTYKGITYNSKEEFINQVINPQFLSNKKVRRVMEVQSDLFQKGRDKQLLVPINEKVALDHMMGNTSQEMKDLLNSNNFLQLLNKDNNWVTFFVRAIIQQTAKERIYEASLPDIEEKVLSLQKEGKLKIDCK